MINTIDQIKSFFPALATGDLYLDAPAGTQVPSCVIEAMVAYLQGNNSNLGGVYRSSQQTEQLLLDARNAFSDFFNASATEVMFGANMTTLTFNLSRAISRSWQPGDEVIVTLLDHAANVSPWEAVAKERGVRIHYAPITDEALLDTEQLCRLINDKTRLIAVTCASNLLGSKVDVERIISVAHKHQALVFLDAVHLLPHMQVDVSALNCDFLVGSVYKFFGPHLGVAFGKKEHLNAFQPYKIKPIAEVSPQRWETGTLNFEAIAGALATVNYIASLGSGASRQEKLISAYEHILVHENHLASLFLERISAFSDVRVLGINDPQRVAERTPTFALHFDHHSASEVARYFASRNIFVGAGKFHADQLIEACGLGNTDIVRVGFTHYHSEGDIAYFFDVLSSLLSR